MMSLIVETLEGRVLLATNPVVSAILRSAPAAQYTSDTSVTYAVTFSETVTGVAASRLRDHHRRQLAGRPTPVVVAGSGARTRWRSTVSTATATSGST